MGKNYSKVVTNMSNIPIDPTLKGVMNDTVSNTLAQMMLPFGKQGKKGREWTNIVQQALRVKDQQQFVNRYVWENLPEGYDSQLIERMFYYKGQLMFYYDKDLNKFKMLPYSLVTKNTQNSLDTEGRYNEVRPYSFTGFNTEKESDNKPGNKGSKEIYLGLITKKVAHDVPFVETEEQALEYIHDFCVLMRDYTNQMSEEITPRQALQEGFVQGQTEILQMMRTALRNATGVQFIRAKDENEQKQLYQQLAAIDVAILNGMRYVVVTGALDLQEGATISSTAVADFWAAYASLDNLRESCLGIDNSGVVQKRAQMLQAEMAMEGLSASHPLLDGWFQRLKACTIINAIWGIGISCNLPSAGMTADGATDSEFQDGEDNGQEGSEGGEEA